MIVILYIIGALLVLAILPYLFRFFAPLLAIGLILAVIVFVLSQFLTILGPLAAFLGPLGEIGVGILLVCAFVAKIKEKTGGGGE